MIFSSPEFLFVFLPVSWAVFLLLWQARAGRLALSSLTAASIVYCGIWRPWDLPVLLGSALFNFGMARLVAARTRAGSLAFVAAVAGNLALLFWFKYAHFASEVASSTGLAHWTVAKQVLPLGISFFTFTQIAYLVDRRRGTAPSTGLGNYLLFVTFFPHLMAGPIIHHKEMMPQFDAPAISWESVARGLFVTGIGLFKKAVIADSLAPLANAGFADPAALGIANAWLAVLAYTLQLYFDFSGYSDMAVGLSLLFGIRLPWNFRSPYKTVNISDFWRRWHVTLSRFLRDYVYIPLGGSRAGRHRTAINLLVVMLLGGVWHGAGWTFVLWGALHGSALAAYHYLKDVIPSRTPWWLGWAVTQFVVVLGWVLFRANSLSDAATMYQRMFELGGANPLIVRDAEIVRATPFLLVGVLIALLTPCTAELEERFRPRPVWVGYGVAVMAAAAFAVLAQLKPPEFLYYDF